MAISIASQFPLETAWPRFSLALDVRPTQLIAWRGENMAVKLSRGQFKQADVAMAMEFF